MVKRDCVNGEGVRVVVLKARQELKIVDYRKAKKVGGRRRAVGLEIFVSQFLTSSPANEQGLAVADAEVLDQLCFLARQPPLIGCHGARKYSSVDCRKLLDWSFTSYAEGSLERFEELALLRRSLLSQAVPLLIARRSPISWSNSFLGAAKGSPAAI